MRGDVTLQGGTPKMGKAGTYPVDTSRLYNRIELYSIRMPYWA